MGLWCSKVFIHCFIDASSQTDCLATAYRAAPTPRSWSYSALLTYYFWNASPWMEWSMLTGSVRCQQAFTLHLHFRAFSRRFCPKLLTEIHTYIHTLIVVAAMQGADQHIRISLGFSILLKDTYDNKTLTLPLSQSRPSCPIAAETQTNIICAPMAQRQYIHLYCIHQEGMKLENNIKHTAVRSGDDGCALKQSSIKLYWTVTVKPPQLTTDNTELLLERNERKRKET